MFEVELDINADGNISTTEKKVKDWFIGIQFFTTPSSRMNEAEEITPPKVQQPQFCFYKLRDGIDKSKIYWKGMRINPCKGAHELLLQRDCHLWAYSKPRLESNSSPMNLNWASARMFPLLKQNMDKINWQKISANSHPEAVKILEQNKDKIDYMFLSENKNAIHLIEENLSKCNWGHLCWNENAIHILEKNQHKIQWIPFSQNTSPRAIQLCLENPDKIHWASFFAKSEYFYL